MEMIMSTTLETTASAPDLAGASWANGILASAKRAWVAYISWRIQRAAIGQLSAMSDRQLKDIGLTRSEIVAAARGFTLPSRWSQQVR
jgi:uncharacterized protein YjiS (DUF1127 family)